jgi:hypothetical protein
MVGKTFQDAEDDLASRKMAVEAIYGGNYGVPPFPNGELSLPPGMNESEKASAPYRR